MLDAFLSTELSLFDILMYIAVGYIFLKTYKFVTLEKLNTEINHLITSSLVVGFIFYTIAESISKNIGKPIHILTVLLSAAVVAYLLAQLFSSSFMIEIFDFLKIRNTGNAYLWDDLLDKDKPMKIIITFENEIYEGMAHYIESYTNTPYIALASYVIKDKNNKSITDCTTSENQVIVVDTSKAKSVELQYLDESEVRVDIQSLVNHNPSNQNGS